MKLSKTTKRK